MTKDEFIKQLREDVDRFSEYIDECNRKYPVVPPVDHGPSVWFEQFLFFVGKPKNER